jgi:hypothetical protein
VDGGYGRCVEACAGGDGGGRRDTDRARSFRSIMSIFLTRFSCFCWNGGADGWILSGNRRLFPVWRRKARIEEADRCPFHPT